MAKLGEGSLRKGFNSGLPPLNQHRMPALQAPAGDSKGFTPCLISCSNGLEIRGKQSSGLEQTVAAGPGASLNCGVEARSREALECLLVEEGTVGDNSPEGLSGATSCVAVGWRGGAGEGPLASK